MVSIGIDSTIAALTGTNQITQANLASFESNGFLVASAPTSAGNGLPYTQITPGVDAQITRNIITWFVPQYGTVEMFINPQNISYTHKKLITKDRTKGGYTLQYWGEELDSLQITGVTGSAGIEGINMLYEIYRAEQYAFDAVGLTLAGNNAAADVSNNLSIGIGGAIGQAVGGIGITASASVSVGLLGGALGLSSPANTLSPRNIPSLAAMAFAVEMYYNGWVYRGFFENMTVGEHADNFLIDYNMTFTATQRRGCRTNYFPWSESPSSGSSSYSSPHSFSGNATLNPNLNVNIVNNPGTTSVVGTVLGLL